MSRFFLQYMLNIVAKQTHKHKVVIAGNHELSFGYCDGYVEPLSFERLLGQHGAKDITSKVSGVNLILIGYV